MKTSNWSLAGYALSIIIAIFMDVRYLWLYYDPSQALQWTAISLLVFGCAWLYNRQLQQANTITAIEDYIAEKGNVERRSK